MQGYALIQPPHSLVDKSYAVKRTASLEYKVISQIHGQL